jgi:hypothetical protein
MMLMRGPERHGHDDLDHAGAMELNLPDWATDWKTAFFTAERRLSPRLEQAVGTDTVLDALTVANSLGRLAHRSADAARYAIADALGLPTSRQIAQLQYSIDRLVDAQQSKWAGRPEPARHS